MFTSDQIMRAIADASREFNIVPQTASLAGMGENVVCAVTTVEGDRYAMRFHRPDYNTLAELESEALWIGALGASGIAIATPRPTTTGNFHAAVEFAGHERHVGVSDWVDGDGLDEILRSSTVDRLGYFRQIGALAAGIRQVSAAWAKPTSFTRRSWDVDAFVGEQARWGRFWQVRSLSADQQDVFLRCRTLLRTVLDTLPTTADRFGLIHADLHLGNLIDTGEALAVVDFDDAGYGWYEFELANALHAVAHTDWASDALAALLDGCRTVDATWNPDPTLIKMFVVIRHLIAVSWLEDRPDLSTPEHLAALVSRAEAHATTFLAAH